MRAVFVCTSCISYICLVHANVRKQKTPDTPSLGWKPRHRCDRQWHGSFYGSNHGVWPSQQEHVFLTSGRRRSTAARPTRPAKSQPEQFEFKQSKLKPQPGLSSGHVYRQPEERYSSRWGPGGSTSRPTTRRCTAVWSHRSAMRRWPGHAPKPGHLWAILPIWGQVGITLTLN